MKKTFIIFAMLAASASCIAQDQYRRNDPFFTFNNPGAPKEISALGSNPEFPFLRNLNGPQQVFRAIKLHDDNTDLDGIMKAIGFENGIEDLQASNITEARLPDGTVGNMGAGGMTSGYYKLDGENGFKAWKITADGGGYVYFLAKCGNEFYPNTGKAAQRSACINAPINVTSDPVQITANGQQNQVTEKVYVYFHVRRQHRRHVYVNAEISDKSPSRPLLLSSTVKQVLVPETYKVTVNSNNQNEMVCPDSTVNVAANISVEKTTTYAGYYEGKTENTYNLVSRRNYRRAERKMRKAERKEEQVARFTRTSVDKAEEPPKA